MRALFPVVATALLLATGCATPTADEATATDAKRASAPEATTSVPAVEETAAPAPDGTFIVDMPLVVGLGPVERNPQALRRKLTTTPPADFVLEGLPAGDWHYGRAPLTKTVGVAFALSLDRSELWFDGNRDGVLTSDELRQGGRHRGRVVWHDGLEALAERSIEGETHTTTVFMAVGAQAQSLNAFSRLDCHRAGVLRAGGEELRIAVVDRTHRGWFGHGSRDRLMVDLDGNGRFETSEESHERYRLGNAIPVGELDLVVQDTGLFGEQLVFGPSEKQAQRLAPLGIGSPAPEIAGIALDGSEVSLSSHRGSWVLIDFWATWCGPCLRELPHLKKLKASHPELVVLGISGDRQRLALENFLERSPLPWSQIYDEKAPIRRLYRVRSLPTSYLVAPDGTIAAKSLRGSAIEQRFKREVERWEKTQQAAGGL